MHWIVCMLLLKDPTFSEKQWGFMAAQEQFVIETVGPESAYKSLDESQKQLLGSLGSDDARHRQWAFREAKKLSRSAIFACYVGQYLPDRHVQFECRTLLRRMSKCSVCLGKGCHPYKSRYAWEEMNAVSCKVCLGYGYLLPVDEF